MMIRVAINGFGRIGRMVFRAGYHHDDIEFVAVNDLTDTATLAHLLKYDTVHGQFDGDVSHTDEALVVNGEKITVLSVKDPSDLPWEEHGVDVAVESTGLFRTKDDLDKHIEAGAKKALLSAPPKSDGVKTIVTGVNDDIYDEDDPYISNASCTTNCLAPMAQVLNEAFGIEKGFMTTVHAYTSSQNIVDGPHGDLRRARHAAENLVPTTTGAAIAVTEVIPELDGKLDGMAVRAPIPAGSLTDFTAVLHHDVSIDDVNTAFEHASNNELNTILGYTEDEVVSSDIVHNPHSCIFDASSTKTNGNLVKVIGWYDNEWGFSCRMIDMIKKLGYSLP